MHIIQGEKGKLQMRNLVRLDPSPSLSLIRKADSPRRRRRKYIEQAGTSLTGSM